MRHLYALKGEPLPPIEPDVSDLVTAKNGVFARAANDDLALTTRLTSYEPPHLPVTDMVSLSADARLTNGPVPAGLLLELVSNMQQEPAPGLHGLAWDGKRYRCSPIAPGHPAPSALALFTQAERLIMYPEKFGENAQPYLLVTIAMLAPTVRLLVHAGVGAITWPVPARTVLDLPDGWVDIYFEKFIEALREVEFDKCPASSDAS